MSTIQIIFTTMIYLVAMFELVLAGYILVLDPADKINRFLSATLFFGFVFIGLGSAQFIGASNVEAITGGVLVYATVLTAINPAIFLLSVLLLKPGWHNRNNQWVWAPLYLFILLPVVLTLFDLITGIGVWYIPLTPADYRGGLPELVAMFSTPVYQFYFRLAFFVVPTVTTLFVGYVALFDRSKTTIKHTAWVLFSAQLLVTLVQAGLQGFLPVIIRVILTNAIFGLAFIVIALGRLISDRSLERLLHRMPLQRKLQIGFGSGVVVVLLTSVFVIMMGSRIQALTGFLLTIDFNDPNSIEVIRQTMQQTQQTQIMAMSLVVGILLLSAAIGSMFTYILSRQILQSVSALRISAESLGEGHLNVRAQVVGTDEIAITASAMNTMAERLQRTLLTMDQRIKDRTQALETSAEISRQITIINDIDTLLRDVVDRIQRGYSFYHTHVYLIDDETGDVVMAEGAGDVGVQLKAKGHRLGIGEGIVGTVVATNESFFSNNVNDLINFVRNPLLPDTNSELAVPLRKGNEVLGVLDIQSTELNRFTFEDVSMMQSIANQIAVAIDNVRLLERTQMALDEVATLNRQLTRGAWQEFGQDLTTAGYVFNGKRVQPDSGTWYPSMIQASRQGRVVSPEGLGDVGIGDSEIAIPLKLRGEVIGVMGVKRAVSQKWQDEELGAINQVADQVARALENARLSKEQKETIVKLQEVDRLKSEFLTSMSHELRTPLNSIIGFADILIQGIDGPLSEHALTDVQAIYSSGKHLLALINDILDLSKIEAGRMELALEPVQVQDIFNDALNSVASIVASKPVELVQDIPPGLPPVWADPLRMNQIVINLVSNAAKFTDEGTIIMRAAKHFNNALHLTVEDTGVGIPPDKLALVFDRFQQVDTHTNRKYQGTGMGLAIVKQLVELHGGEIWLESTEGVGSKFHFTLPIVQAGHQLSRETSSEVLDNVPE